jgi:hypothetical protein
VGEVLPDIGMSGTNIFSLLTTNFRKNVVQ